ncbi:MAG: DUF6134 family protein [Porticoccaceae bacterium]
MRLFLVAVLLLLSLQSPVFAQQDSNTFEKISFNVFLDKKQVGTHIFDIQRKDVNILVKSNMQLRGKFWGLVPFKYTHQSTEQWKNGCLVSLESQTLKRGKTINISASSGQSGLTVINADKIEVIKGCIKSFAYWDPSKLEGHQLLNTENAQLVDVQIERSKNQNDASQSIIIQSSEADIKLQYSADGDWLWLKSKLEVGGLLHYIRQ